jgi:hypothetical protein
MQIRKEGEGVVLEFFPAEAHFLANILERIADAYDEADADKFRTPELGDSGYAEDDIESWKLEFRELESENALMARKWSDILTENERDWVRWSLGPEDIEKFLLMSNDHRMYLARRFAVSQEDMEMSPDEMADDERRMVLLEIHLLAQLMELLLPHAPL